MHYTVEALVQGSAEIPRLYKRAGEKWAERRGNISAKL